MSITGLVTRLWAGGRQRRARTRHASDAPMSQILPLAVRVPVSSHAYGPDEPDMISRLSVPALLAVALLAAAFSPAASADNAPIAPKVLVITVFGGEAKPWLEGEAFTRRLAPPGLSKAFPEVACSDDGLCLITVGMGYANAANSIAALVFGGRFDLTKTYFLIAGIAGVGSG
jgi:purine nucleoside permease